jgi:hypothetical protein
MLWRRAKSLDSAANRTPVVQLVARTVPAELSGLTLVREKGKETGRAPSATSSIELPGLYCSLGEFLMTSDRIRATVAVAA